MNKKLLSGIGGALLAVTAAAVLYVGGTKKRVIKSNEIQSKMAYMAAPRPVEMARVASLSSGNTRRFPATVKASEEAALSFRVGGPLTQVNVKLGTPVKKGALLMQIDPRDFEDRIESLEAQLSGAVAVERNAMQNYKRIAELFEEKVVPQTDFDAATSVKDATDAAVKNIKAELQIARHALMDTSLIAPYDGTVTLQLAENYEMVKLGQIALRFQNIQTLEVAVSIPENEIVSRAIDEDTPVQVSFSAVPNRQFDAHLKEWSSTADPMTRTYAVIFAFRAPEAFRILPGMSASISWIEGNARESVLTVPVSSLTSGLDGSTCVWAYNETADHVERRPVSVGELKGANRIIVTSGLSEGEQVVVSGSRLIHESMTLKAIAIN